MQLPTWNAPTSLTPDAIERRRRLAEALMTQGMDYSPVQSPWQGAARLASALAGNVQMARADKADATLRREAELKDATEKAKAEAEKRNTPDWQFTDDGIWNKNPYMHPDGPLQVQAFQKKQSERKKTRGLDGRYYFDDTSEPVFPEGHPANTAVTKQTLPAQAINKTIDADAAVRNLSTALDEYENIVTGKKDETGQRSGGTGYAFTGVERNTVGTALEGIKMAMKDAYELGALTGPDVVVLENMLVDPRTSWTSTLNPFEGERGLFGVVGNTIGQVTGAADTGINTRVTANVKQVKAEFKRRLQARLDALKAQYRSGVQVEEESPPKLDGSALGPDPSEMTDEEIREALGL